MRNGHRNSHMNVLLFSLCLCITALLQALTQMSPLEKAYLPRKLGHSDLLLKNMFIRSAAYEGMLEHGLPSRDLIDHHVTMAKSLPTTA